MADDKSDGLPFCAQNILDETFPPVRIAAMASAKVELSPAEIKKNDELKVLSQFSHAQRIAKFKQDAIAAKRWRTSSWAELIIINRSGEPVPIIANAITILRHSPEMKGIIRWDTFFRRIVCGRTLEDAGIKLKAGEWTDRHTASLTEWVQHAGVHVSTAIVRQAIETVSEEDSFNPVTEYLDGCKWDGVPRIDRWLVDLCGAELSDYVLAIGAKFMIGAAARAFEPGCKQDTALVLEGLQGINKSTTFKVLAGEFFSDDMESLHGKEAAMQAAAGWIIELGELSALTRSSAQSAGIEAVKAFLTRQEDKFRRPYGAGVISAPRQSIFVGTVNPDGSGYLRDQENRRFWPVKIGDINIEKLRNLRDLLWAEAVQRYRDGKRLNTNYLWWLDENETRAAMVEQSSRRMVDEWQYVIERFIHECPQSDGRGGQFWEPRRSPLEKLTLAEILGMALQLPAGKWGQSDQNRVARCLKSMGWVKKAKGYVPSTELVIAQRLAYKDGEDAF